MHVHDVIFVVVAVLVILLVFGDTNLAKSRAPWRRVLYAGPSDLKSTQGLRGRTGPAFTAFGLYSERSRSALARDSITPTAAIHIHSTQPHPWYLPHSSAARRPPDFSGSLIVAWLVRKTTR